MLVQPKGQVVSIADASAPTVYRKPGATQLDLLLIVGTAVLGSPTPPRQRVATALAEVRKIGVNVAYHSIRNAIDSGMLEACGPNSKWLRLTKAGVVSRAIGQRVVMSNMVNSRGKHVIVLRNLERPNRYDLINDRGEPLVEHVLGQSFEYTGISTCDMHDWISRHGFKTVRRRHTR